MKNILDLTKELGIPNEYVQPYGWDKAKIDYKYREVLKDRPDGKLVLVTAITPTKAGEGKTTTTIGLHDGLRRIGVNSLACLREPSLGPVWGIKGGAVGALKSTIIPSDDINLHFTGDFHALTSTINLMSAIIENHIWQGNELNIDPNRIEWKRALDVNDRSLRSAGVNADGTAGFDLDGRNLDIELDKLSLNGGTKEDLKKLRDKKSNHNSEFVITVASELMTILTISQSEEEFIDRVNKIIAAYDYDGNPVYFGQFNCSKAILKMMRNAMNPNVVQTLEENPVLVHCGPFANISIGVNSINATKLALKLSDVVVTEAGFGGDLGAEKFLDIKCQLAGIHPNVIVLVATARALKLHGGVAFEDLEKENVEAVKAGICNLQKHYENMTRYGVPVVVAINRFPSDTDAELEAIGAWCKENKINWAINTAALDGGDGAVSLARTVQGILNVQDSEAVSVFPELADHFEPLYPLYPQGDYRNYSIDDKIGTICHNIYGADRIEYSDLAREQMRKYTDMGYSHLPVCISKTPNSLTDDPKVLGAPTGFTIHIREIRLYSGAGLIVPLSGKLLLMPGLPKEPRCLDKFN